MILLSIPSNGTIIKTDFQMQTSVATILYVGGNGPNNYTTIQQAITNATNGDTVFVYDDSSPYFEHIIIQHINSSDWRKQNNDHTSTEKTPGMLLFSMLMISQ